tara:strand:- start:2327 stop:2614 length:288 start_codon:yes stop_codon:yes gene_type:complete
MTNLVTKSVELIYQMDNDQLNEIVDAIKLKRTYLAKQAVRSFLVGDIVQFTKKNGMQVSGQVRKINKKYIIVNESATGTQWKVPGTMLTKLGIGA